MSFQSTVRTVQGSGVIGELANDGPVRATSYTLVSGATDNVVGNAFTVSSEGVAEAGGTGTFAGILANPKVYASQGTASNTLGATLVLDDYAIGELVTMGTMYVELDSAASIGDTVVYDVDDGSLDVISAGASLPSGFEYAFAKVTGLTVSSPGIAEITITETPDAG